MTNTLPRFIYGKLDTNEYNFRIWRTNVYDAIRGTACDWKNWHERGQGFENNWNHEYDRGHSPEQEWDREQEMTWDRDEEMTWDRPGNWRGGY